MPRDESPILPRRRTYRPDQDGTHKQAFRRNKKKILLTQDTCALCGKPVDKSLTFPHPLSPTVDHIIPIDKGGHPSAIENLQLAHLACNLKKRDRVSLAPGMAPGKDADVPARLLPHSLNWMAYRAK